MTKQLKWRLGKLPTPDEVLKLVNDKLITKEEARDILFNEETGTERDVKSLEDEIKFLRELVQKLSNNNSSRIVEVIREVQKPYLTWDWYRPYQVWCNSSSLTGDNGTVTTYATALNTSGRSNTTYLLNGGGGTVSGQAGITNFSNIKTF